MSIKYRSGFIDNDGNKNMFIPPEPSENNHYRLLYLL